MLGGLFIISSANGSLLYGRKLTPSYGLTTMSGASEQQLSMMLYSLFMSSNVEDEDMSSNVRSLKWIRTGNSFVQFVNDGSCIYISVLEGAGVRRAQLEELKRDSTRVLKVCEEAMHKNGDTHIRSKGSKIAFKALLDGMLAESGVSGTVSGAGIPAHIAGHGTPPMQDQAAVPLEVTAVQKSSKNIELNEDSTSGGAQDTVKAAGVTEIKLVPAARPPLYKLLLCCLGSSSVTSSVS